MTLDSNIQTSTDEQPAGELLEQHWARMARWGKVLSVLMAGYVCFICFANSSLFSIKTIQLLGWHWVILVAPNLLSWFIPVVITAYFCLRFGYRLQLAIKHHNQTLLENAFRQLHRFLMAALLAGAVQLPFRFMEMYGETWGAWKRYHHTAKSD